MGVKDKFFKLFKRKTTSVTFIPEIDGLRFLAIFLVVIAHIQTFYLLRNNPGGSLAGAGGFWQYLLNNGEAGVLLFFTISGFILMFPFARYYLLKTEKPSLKKYYWRRVLRLEPPYFLAMVSFFVLKIMVRGEDFSDLLPHLGASLLYLHQEIYHQMSRITPIAWSLEIEIQFYLLAPFLAGIFRLPKLWRRVILLLLIFSLPVIQYSLGIAKDNFFGTMQYFLVGFMLLDLYLCQDKIIIKKSISKPLGVVFLLLLILLKPDLLGRIFIYPILIFSFYYLVLNTEFWNGIFKNKLLTSIGGMCYSIYLLHFAIISFVSAKSILIHSTNSYILNILIQGIIQIPVILLIGAVFYLLVEKPCMNPLWPQRMRDYIWPIKFHKGSGNV